jgi:cytochrome P450
VLTRDVVYRDTEFPAGALILIGAVTGNRDGLEPADFDITAPRDNARIMTFGAGIHFCVGANLARAELEEALLFLAPRLRGLRLDGEPEFGTVQGIYGVGALPLAWDPDRSRSC